MRYRIFGVFMDTRSNNENFALTPYLVGVWRPFRDTGHIAGIGLCWGWYRCYIGIGSNIPDTYSSFKTFTKKDSTK